MKLKFPGPAAVALAALILLPYAATAQETRPAGAAAVAPFLDNTVVIVGRADLSRIEPAAVEAWVTLLVKDLDLEADAAGQLTKEAAAARPAAEQWLAAFRQAGGREVYMILNPLDLPAGGPPTLIVPVAVGGDAAALLRVFSPGGGGGAADPAAADKPRAERVGNAVVFGHPAAVRRLRETKPVARPDVVAALAAGGDAPVQVAVIPSPDTRRAVQEMLPRLPAELGGGETAAITGGLQWASVSLRLPPQAAVRVVFQSPGGDAAAALAGAIKSLLAAGEKAANALPPDVRPDPAALSALLASLAPQTQGERNVVSLTDADFRRTARGVLGGLLRQARAQALRVQGMSNMRQVLLVALMWGNNHKNEWPDDLSLAAKEADIPPETFRQLMQNPEKPGTGFTYVKPGLPAKDVPANRIVLYATEAAKDGRNVGFADGHTEFMREPDFQKALATQQAKDKK